MNVLGLVRRCAIRRTLATFCLLPLALGQAPLLAADLYWDPDGNSAGNNEDGTGLGGPGSWDSSALSWWNLTSDVAWPNTGADSAIFTYAYPALGLPVLNTVNLSGGITANQLSFRRSGYTLNGSTLTLAGTTPGIRMNLGESATINSQILGTSGLTLTGGGWVRLGNNTNGYTGTTTLNNGALVITGQGALGADTSAINITRINSAVGSTGLRGFGGGALVLDGTGGSIDITRDLNMQGNGPWSDRGGALLSTGVNTLSGMVDMGGVTNGANVNTRIIAADGTLNLTGALNVQGTAGTTINQFGGVNQAGASFYNVTGVLAGTGTLEASGGGTLFLNPTDSSGFSGVIRVSGSAASGQSVVRIDSPNVLGTRTSTGTGGVLDMNGGVLAILMDTPSVLAGGSAANVYGRAGSTFFADHTPNSSVKDQTVTFGQFAFEENQTFTFNSRNGYGMTFSAAPVQGGNNNSTLNNNLQGGALLTFTGNFWSNSDNTGNRTMTFGGNGNTLISGNIVASSAAFNHNLTKTGTGTLTITSTGSTLDGTVNVNGGTVAINDWRSITNNTSIVDIGSGTTSATLAVIGNNVNQTNLTTSKVIQLGGTTGGATILANQTGTSPGLIMNGNFNATGAGIKNLTLGGSNAAANTINGVISDNSATNKTSLVKIDPGIWVLAGNNVYTGTTTISNGTLRIKADAEISTVVHDSSNIVFNATNVYAGGTLEFVGQPSVNNVETLGSLVPTNGSGTVKLTPGSGGTASLVFSSLGTVGDGATVNFAGVDAFNTITLTGATGLASPRLFFEGADFAFADGGVLRAPVYGTDADFAASTDTALTATQSNEIIGSFSNGAVTVDTLKFNGSHTLTLTGALTVRTGAGGSDGAMLATGGDSTITGGSITTGGAGSLTFYVDGGANSLTLESAISSGTTGGLTKAGAGTLRLAGANAQTGTISINEGAIRLVSGGSLGGAAALTIRQGAALELNGVTPASNINAFNNNGVVRNTSATTDVTLTVGGGNGTGTSNGIVEDGGTGKVSLVKIGSGNQSWLGLSTYTGTTTIGSTGLVLINNLQDGGMASGIGASSNAAGNLVFNGSSTTQAYGGIRYTGTTNDETDRLFTLDGGADGGARIEASGANGSTSTWTNTGTIAFGPNATGNPQGIVFGGSSTGDNRFFPSITDNGAAVTSVYKADAGVWYLEATNTYTGPTTIRGGALYVTTGTSLPTASNLVLDGGSLARTGAFTRTIGTGANQVQWNGTSSGGFSAGGSSLTVDWGSGAIWGTTPGFLGSGAALLLNNSGVAKADVEVLSSFDLGGAVRTVTVGDFTSIGADFATISGVISGTGAGLLKNGAGILNLRGANTYDGTTQISQGTLVVTSLGNSASPGSTSVGDSALGNTNAGAVLLGNGTTTGGILEYVGLGETSDRKIRLNTTTGTNQIHADGVGSLILTNVVNDLGAGAKTLSLRGVSSAANFITSQLSNNGGSLSITIDGSTAWVLTNGANDYSGTTTVGAGALGIGDNGALGASTLTLSSGSVFAYGADRVLSNAVNQANNTTTAFIGDYSLTFGNVTGQAAANNWGTTNNLVSGKTLTFGAWTANSLTADRTWTIDGSGTTIINGNITSSTAFGVNLTKTGNGVLQLNGTGSNYNQSDTNTDIDRGTLRLGASGVIPEGAGFGGVILSPESANGDLAIFDLNGFTETINGLTMNTDGTAIIDNTSASAASLVFGANDSAVSIGGGIGTYIIQNSGGGALSITKTGNTSAVIPTGVTLTYHGGTTVNGGSFTIASPIDGSTSLSVINSGSTLALTGGITSPSAIQSVVVENGGTLSLLDGFGNKLNSLTNLQLGSSGGTMTTLNLNVGDFSVSGDELFTDTLTLLSGGSLGLFSGNQITFNLTDIGLNPGETYELLRAVGGGLTTGPLTNVNYLLGATPGGFDSFTLTANDNSVFVTTGDLVIGDLYWRGLAGGGTDNTWNGNANNWSVDKANTSPATSTPGQGTDVIFAIDSAAGAIVTTLEQNFKVNSLTFEAGTSTPTSVTIDPGAVATNRIEIAPQLATDGITVSAGGPAAVTISGPVRLGGLATSQTWNVADAGTVLSLGALQGERDVTKTGLGKVVLTGAADPTFNSGQSSDFILNAGTLEITNAAALGNTINSNLATVTINGGAAFYYNGATGNVANPITLGGGTLSVGTASQTYSGAVDVSGNSFINLRDSNSATLTTTQRDITLSGALTGSGSITLDSISTLSSGNQITGNLIITNSGNGGWSGDLNILRGTVIARGGNENSLGTGAINFESGKIEWEGAGGVTYTINKDVTVASATGNALAEWNIDRTSGSGTFKVTNTGTLTLGSNAGTGELRIFLQDTGVTEAEFSGTVSLANDGILNVRNSALSLAAISGNIVEVGGARSLSVNSLATWGGTGATLRLTGSNSFTGNLSLGAGVLEFNTVTNAGGGASALGNGTAISIGSATLSFIGSSNQATDRAITQTGASIYSADGTGGATITYNGAIDAAGNNFTLTGTGVGTIAGGITQTGDTADGTVNGGTWTHQTGTSRVGDDLTVTGASTIFNLDSGLLQVRDDFTVTAGATLNLNGTGVLSYGTATLSADASLLITNGGVVNLGANDAVVDTDFDRLFLGQNAGGAVATLNMNAFNLTTNRLILGERLADRNGVINGTGTLTVTGGDIDLYEGTINANLASTGTATFEKFGPGMVTLAGDNSGLASTGSTIVNEGTLVLDYTANIATKLRVASLLDMRGSNLVINGSGTTGTSQTVTGFNMASGGSNRIQVNAGSGQEAVLVLGAITRGNAAQDGTVRFVLPAGAQTATNGITTTSPNSTFGMLGTGSSASSDSAYATVQDATGTWFATANAGNVVALVSITNDDVASWGAGDHITDGSGFTGTLDYANVNSLRFNASSGSDLLVSDGGVLLIGSGGFLVTDNVGGTPSLMGGTLVSGATEMVITQDSSQTFEISSNIRINGAVTKTGAGTLLLTGNNVYTDETEIQEGTLQVAGGNAIGDTSIVTLASNRDTTFQLLEDETIGRLAGGRRNDNSDYGNVIVGTHTLTLNQSSSTTYAGFLTGTGNIVMNSGNTGNLNLTNLSTGFSGVFTVDGGLLQLSALGQINANIIRVGKGGNLLIDNNGTTRSGTRILDTTAITLNSADGAFSGQVRPRGLAIRTDQDATLDETVGVVTLASGANYSALEATTASDDSDIIVNDLVRLNNSTLNIRGTNLGGSSSQENEFRIGDATNQTNFIAANLVGGGGAAGSQNISIVPWAIGESFTGALGDANMGNSLLTYVSGSGFRPLSFTTEYDTLGLAAPTDNARESLTADLTGLGGTTVNALVLHNNNTADSVVNVSGSGSGQSLSITSGALLFTLNSGATASTLHAINLGGFEGGVSVGATNEYVIHVVNPSAAATTAVLTATISSPLTSLADITKSGRGALVLSGINTAGGGVNRTTINEGILEISDLDNIGGNSGALVFAGGILRLGAGLTDDISLRTITLLDAGGTIDTNGIDLAFGNSVGTGLGGFTKSGSGILTLNAAATYTGSTVVSGGILAVGVDNATGNGGALTVGAGATLALGASSISTGLVTFNGADPAITGTGTITSSVGYFFDHDGGSDLVTVDAVLAGAGGIFKANRDSNLALNGLNTFTGRVEIQRGTLSFNSIGSVGGGASALGAPTTIEDGIIRMGLTGSASILNYTGSGHTSDRLIGMQGTTGAVTIDADGTGALGLGGVRFENNGNKTLTLRGSSDPGLENSVGLIRELGGVLTLNKSDGNTWLLNAANEYSGPTQVDNGTLRISLANSIPVASAMRIGSGTTAGTLDLNGFDQTVASLVVQTNSNSVTNTLVVDSGNTYSVTGNVTIGVNAAASTTLFSATGGGSFVNNNDGGTFQVGGGTGSTNVNAATADFSGLTNFTVNLGSGGTFRVGDNNTNSSGSPAAASVLILASTANTITAGTVGVGDEARQDNSLHTLSLGGGTNVINTDTFNIGAIDGRSDGLVNFAGSTGSLTLRAADGTSRAAINLTNSAFSTGADQTAELNLAGHDADILASTVNMAFRTANIGNTAATLTFDQGTLDVTTLNMASRTGSGSGAGSAIVNLGDSAAPGTPTVTIGTINMAVNTSTGTPVESVTADLNITGGNVTIGTGSGTAINMANAGSGRSVTSSINITGGSVSVTGNAVRSVGAGTETASVTLDGGVLDLNGNSVGSAAGVITLNAQSGTLRNLGELNGGGTLTKSTAGILVLEGDNNYTGATRISGGTLSISSEENLGDNPAAFNAAQLEIDGGTLQTTASFAIDDSNRGITVGAAGGSIETSASTALTIGSGNAIVLSGNLEKSGTGALYVNSTSTGTGAVTVSAGTMGGTGTISGATTVQNGSFLTGGTDGTVGTLTFGGDLTMDAGSTWLVDLIQDVNGSSDLIGVASGALNLNSASLSLALSGAFTADNVYTIATFNSLAGTFNGLSEGSIISNYRINYGTVTSGAITLTAVPEPGTLGLLGLALGGFFLRRRKKRSSATEEE
ncbi:MAG: autotransporter-associated beta strand repeat-containing protein [Verrucomicrobiae bacterium]|nr:autotransporter-associated beta strand repeat-containing protein [Verrucomicrobiae bacterium]